LSGLDPQLAATLKAPERALPFLTTLFADLGTPHSEFDEDQLILLGQAAADLSATHLAGPLLAWALEQSPRLQGYAATLLLPIWRRHPPDPSLVRAALALEPSACQDPDAAYNLGLLLAEALGSSERPKVDAALDRLMQAGLHPSMTRVLQQQVSTARQRR
jgi:hypothetical protein